MSDMEAVLRALAEPFPEGAIKRRRGGQGREFDYVDGASVIRRLTRATFGRWSWRIVSFEFRPLPPTGRGQEQALVVVQGELTIDGLGTRAGIGVQRVVGSDSEDLVKGASTDALKKAATLFGVALDLYGEDHEAGDAPQTRQDAPGATEPGAAYSWADLKPYLASIGIKSRADLDVYLGRSTDGWAPADILTAVKDKQRQGGTR